MAKIIQNHEECIGCGTCIALCPKYWEWDEDNKARIKAGKFDKNKKEYELEVDDIECNKDAYEACPVQVIRIE